MYVRKHSHTPVILYTDKDWDSFHVHNKAITWYVRTYTHTHTNTNEWSMCGIAWLLRSLKKDMPIDVISWVVKLEFS